jgi:HD-GYP domain-containing protein (c-di-GMP phosphodiesterase class II)
MWNMKKTLLNIHQSGNELDPGFQAFSDLNFVLNTDGKIVDYNAGPFVSDSFPENIIHQNLQDLLPDDLADRFKVALQNVRQSGDTDTQEYCITISGREYWFDARLIPLSKSQVMFTARDITKCKETEHRLKRQMQHLSALRSIDIAIASGLDLNLLLTMLLDQVSTLLQIDAVSVLLLNHKTNLLEFTASKGFRSSSLQHTHLQLGDGCAGRVALERKMVRIPNLKDDHAAFDRSPLFKNENFIAYYGIPLLAKGRLLGVLECFHRSPHKPDTDWLDFLTMLGGQAAIAIDSARMFKELQRTNLELSLAYDATIEGLSRALDLRDKETEEHTQRVTDLTVKLALRLNVDSADLVHIRRGAVLHDIGKVAIPDRILLKPGPLADDEWLIMRRHPGIAVELLSPVAYLAQALEIPHWHHEKWDGTGYPDRLAGDEIPFAARMFALADVFDALTSDRPYRGAWSKKDTVEYIESHSGRHFDPRLVPEFLDLVSTYKN